ncbi:ABC-2 type transport system permease protein [Arcticibacter pallidicorallinus]|uniref:ABC-2 type transport system permease protein n=1 Tax=Arcticibacter pallidicorallinus TaxID=1259464 RepID=A0A2T0TU21_9SPHI|nr:Gldg family protein [Arcticibacter pallidicorallinus]PRY49206.1 ABC-2 type transport system permease protein [Arcticibacter pallidicorallinus]
MKKIFKIAKLELSLLFYSPIAWIVLIIFIVQCGLSFTDLLYTKETSQQLGSTIKSLTADIFGGGKGFFSAVQGKLFLYIPLLTMGLMSREISSGSIKLLLSSPVTIAEIILGKFFAMMLYGFLLVSVLLCIMLAGAVSIENLDFGFVAGGILGLYMLICAYAAIGLFMSSLTSYQVVAAISTLAIFAALKFVGNIGQTIDFVRDITYWISIDGRADNFVNGLISSKDVIYFLLVIGLFLLLTIMRLNSGREIISASQKVMRYSLLVIAVLAIGYLSSLPSFTRYFDTTRFKNRTLTAESQAIIKQLDGPVTLTSYVNLLNINAHLGAPKFRIFELRQFDQYLRYLPDLKINYVPYYDSTMTRNPKDKTLEERAERAATAFGYEFEDVLSPAEIKNRIDLVPEENRFVRTMEYKGKTTFLRMFADMIAYPQEAEVSAALKRLIGKPAIVGVLSGNDERNIVKTGDKAYQNITTSVSSRTALINHGFDVLDIAIDQYKAIPDSLSVLVIADPITAYTPEQLAKINAYIAAGGNILIAGEPGKQGLLNPFLKQFGVSLNEGTLLQKSDKYELDLIQTHTTKEASTYGLSLPESWIVTTPGAVAVNYGGSSDYKAVPVLVANKPDPWIKYGTFNLETDKITFNRQTDKKVPAVVAVALSKKFPNKEQKVLITGDADFMSNAELSRSNIRIANFEFAVQVFKWFSNGEYPINTSRPDPIDNKITVSRSEINWMKMLLLGVLPIALALAGSITLIRRKRK